MKTKTLKAPAVSSHTRPSVIYTVDSIRNGIEFGRFELNAGADPREEFGLALENSEKPLKLRARHSVNSANPLFELEQKLRRVSEKGDLSSASFYFGVTSDPFHPFDEKFDASMQFLKLFQKYTPGMLTIQTRSPVVVIPLAILQELGKHVVVNFGIETCDEDVVSRYTPELPAVSERIRAASALKNFGIEVHFQVSPLLPYGNRTRKARAFAELLCEYASSIFVRPVNDGSVQGTRRSSPGLIARALAADRKSEWLRPDAAAPLIRAIRRIAPEKLAIPSREHMDEKQLSFFVA